MSANITETLKALRQDVDKNLVKQRAGYKDRGGNQHYYDYVEWHTVADILDDKAPGWAHTVKDIQQIGDVVTVTVAITIGGITREGIGTGAAETELGIKKAEHDALKRAAVKFGVARELYKKESEEIERGGSASNHQAFDINNPPANAFARSMADTVTAKQLSMIRAIARELGIDADDDCKAHLNCHTDELNRKGASWFIQYLQEQEKTIKVSDHNTQQLNNGKSGVSPETKGKLLFEGGFVAKSAKGYTVTETIGGNRLVFDITRTGNITSCTCGEYLEKSASVENYYCPHKYAVKFSAEAKK